MTSQTGSVVSLQAPDVTVIGSLYGGAGLDAAVGQGNICGNRNIAGAGAFGNPQFLPSVYLRLAKDGDGDDRRDGNPHSDQ